MAYYAAIDSYPYLDVWNLGHLGGDGLALLQALEHRLQRRVSVHDAQEPSQVVHKSRMYTCMLEALKCKPLHLWQHDSGAS